MSRGRAWLPRNWRIMPLFKHRACHPPGRAWHFSCSVDFVLQAIPENPIRKADPSRRRAENANGPFFIDDECISCGACWRAAPSVISCHPVHTFAFFSRQPGTQAELAEAGEALRICPVGAIGIEDSA